MGKAASDQNIRQSSSQMSFIQYSNKVCVTLDADTKMVYRFVIVSPKPIKTRFKTSPITHRYSHHHIALWLPIEQRQEVNLLGSFG